MTRFLSFNINYEVQIYICSWVVEVVVVVGGEVEFVNINVSIHIRVFSYSLH